MASVNKVILVGNLGADPEMRSTASGMSVANVTIATSEQWTDKQTNQRQERTEWHKVVFWNRLAEIVGQYLRKGSSIYVEGSLQTKKWQDQSGQDRYTTEIVARSMQMFGSKNDNAGGFAGNQNNNNFASNQNQPPMQNQAPMGQPPQAQPQNAPTAVKPANDFDDDIPF